MRFCGRESLISSEFSGLKILVTGASGFIGSHLCERLCLSGAEVHAISRVPQRHKENGPQWWRGDLSEFARVHELLSTIRPDLIFHLAGPAVGSRDRSMVMSLFRDHLVSSVNLFTVASEFGCKRFVLTGSMDEPDPGEANAVPSSPNVAAKWASGAYARMFHALYQLPVVILRVFMVYGPGQGDLQKMIPSVILSLLRKERPKLTSGVRKVDWVYVDDVVDGLVTAATKSGIVARTIDIGSGRLVSIRSLVEQLVRMISPQTKPRFGALADRPLEQERRAKIEETYSLLGWKPETPLEEGLKQTVDWYECQVLKGSF